MGTTLPNQSMANPPGAPRTAGHSAGIIIMDGKMSRCFRISAACLSLACVTWPCVALAATSKSHPPKPEPPQDTGFLNRHIELHGITYRFQVYLPEEWRRDDGRL